MVRLCDACGRQPCAHKPWLWQWLKGAGMMRLMTLKFLRRCCALGSLCALAAATTAVYASDLPLHHRSGSLQNNCIDFAPRGMADFLRWRWNALRKGLPPSPAAPTPSVPPDLDFIHANAGAGSSMQPAVTWVGHATVLAQVGGINLLTDPIFSERASPLSFAGPRRVHAPRLPLRQLPRIDLVVGCGAPLCRATAGRRLRHRAHSPGRVRAALVHVRATR